MFVPDPKTSGEKTKVRTQISLASRYLESLGHQIVHALFDPSFSDTGHLADLTTSNSRTFLDLTDYPIYLRMRRYSACALDFSICISTVHISLVISSTANKTPYDTITNYERYGKNGKQGLLTWFWFRFIRLIENGSLCACGIHLRMGMLMAVLILLV